jgi:integrase
MVIEVNEILETKQNPLELFTYALKSPESQRQYPRRFKVFLDFLNLGVDKIEEQSNIFLLKAMTNPSWTEEMLMKFCIHQKKRVEKGEISKSTIPNYFKATKLFCDMNNIILNWKKISKGIPSSKKAANDRAPTLEEIQKLLEYPDRRIKAIIYVMVSSGIRIGAWDFLKWKHVKPYY